MKKIMYHTPDVKAVSFNPKTDLLTTSSLYGLEDWDVEDDIVF